MADDHDAADFSLRLDLILRRHQEFRRHVIPLCAAETPMSDYVRSFMCHPIHEKYAMGGPLRLQPRNFVGAEHVLDLHQLTVDLCRKSFGAGYADPRPLSGTSAVTNLLMTLSEPGQRVLLQTSASGGHPSMTPICRRLGLRDPRSALQLQPISDRWTSVPRNGRADRLRSLRSLRHPVCPRLQIL